MAGDHNRSHLLPLSRHGHHHCDSDIRVHHGDRLWALGHKHGHCNPEGSIASNFLRHRERNQEEANDFSAAGVACIGVSVFLQVENADLSVINNLFLFVFSFIANATLLTVVMSDFMLGMIRQGQLQAVALPERASGEITQPKGGLY